MAKQLAPIAQVDVVFEVWPTMSMAGIRAHHTVEIV
jgi:hypothetical protein